jgi:hypothetical protein
MDKLTPKQSFVLNELKKFISKKGYPQQLESYVKLLI